MIPQPMRSIKTPEELLHRMTDRIRQSIELPEILSATVDEMRRFLGTDRIKVYHFDDDGSGEVIAEAIREQRLPSLLGHRFPAEDIPEYAREMFLNARQRTIVNVVKQEIGISPLLCHTTQRPVASNLWVRPVDPCHAEYLTAMGVRSSLVVPILHRHQLWGLLVAHHSLPRRVSRKELEVVQLIADQVAVAISHASLLRLTRLQGQHEALINQVVSLLHSTAPDPFQKALNQTMMALQCIGGRLYIPGIPEKNPEGHCQLVISGVQPELSKMNLPASQRWVLEQLPDWQTWLEAEAPNQLVDQLWAMGDIKQTQLPWTLASALMVKDIRGVLVARLSHRNRFLGYLSLFRHSMDVETVWAGRLDASDPRQRRPRQSFETWRELKRAQVNPWTAQEIGLVQDLADQFASVIYQTQLYQEVQALNTDLESRVMQRTIELQQLNESLRQEIKQRERTLQELQQARDSLKRLSHQNELILNSAGEGIYGIDPEGKAVFINPAAAKTLGYAKEKLIGQFMHDLLNHATAEKSPYAWEQSPIFKTLDQGQTHHGSGDLFERQDGSNFPIEYISTPIYENDTNDTIVGAVVIFKDITERQVIESMKDEFIAVVSHELRTPLTSIRAALGLLAEETLEIPASKRQRMVNIAFANTKRLVRLVNDILDVERIKLSTLNPKKCNLAKIMAQAADEMCAMAEDRDIHLDVFPISVQLWAAPDRLIQTLTNLLSNAIKFSPIGTTVEMRAQQVDLNNASSFKKELNPQGKAAIQLGLDRSEALLLIQVKDQGQGIPNDKIEAIFGRFEQLDASDIGHQGGTGLGLAICRSIVQQHGGKIWAQSTVGLGSTFYFTLPYVPESGRTAP
ncbi:MAG: ATP-binding protein [Cyanobacteria bacterium P01_A01_bin.114]